MRSFGATAVRRFVLVLGAATVAIGSPAASAAPGCGSAGAINGTSGNDVLQGTSAAEVLCGHGGNDTINGFGGNDTIYGGSGSDKVYAGSGNDRAAGDDGADLVYGQAGNDSVYGGSQNDAVYGGGGDDVVRGERDNDKVKGEAGNDRVFGDHGADKVFGDEGRDSVLGGSGHDALFGGPDNDSLNGETGRNSCAGEGGSLDRINDFTCGQRTTAEALGPAYASPFTCGPNDISCLAFSAYPGTGVLGLEVCNKHNCTNYATYRLTRRGITADTRPRGNAYQWDNSPGALAVLGNAAPAPGDVAQWESLGTTASNNCGGTNCGHVAYVERVVYDAALNIAAIVVSESVWCKRGAVRTISRSSASWPTRFLRR